MQCLKISPHTRYRTGSPSYHHPWCSCCWPCRHRNCHWFLPGRCAWAKGHVTCNTSGIAVTTASINSTPHMGLSSFPPESSPRSSLTVWSTLCLTSACVFISSPATKVVNICELINGIVNKVAIDTYHFYYQKMRTMIKVNEAVMLVSHVSLIVGRILTFCIVTWLLFETLCCQSRPSSVMYPTFSTVNASLYCLDEVTGLKKTTTLRHESCCISLKSTVFWMSVVNCSAFCLIVAVWLLLHTPGSIICPETTINKTCSRSWKKKTSRQ